MLKVAITGNIAAGKSTVEKIIEDLNYKVFDTDKIAHKILETSDEIIKLFETNDRKAIAEIVFSNPDKLKKLEALIHPKVKEEIFKIFELEERIIFISVPQLFEARFETLFDKIIFVTADENIRKKRLQKRNSFTSEEAQKRIDAQDKEVSKINKCDFIIENNGNIDELSQKVKNILTQLIPS